MKYIYSFIRKDLTHTQRIIQTLHSGFELALLIDTYGPQQPSSVVLFEVDTEEDIIDVHRYLLEKGLIANKDFYVFFEPDRNDGWTSITTRPMKGAERELFANFNLYRDERDTEQDRMGRSVLITEGRGA